MRIAICDDDKSSAEQCGEWLYELSERYNIPVSIVHFENGQQLLFELEDESSDIDLIYLDIVMPKLGGLETAEKIRSKGIGSEIIFLTSSADGWEKAFDFEAANYLVKNRIDKERFDRVFLKVAKKIRLKDSESILLSCAGERRKVPISEIDYFEVRKNIITVHYGENSFDFYSPIAKVEEELSGKGFIRSHRSFLVSGEHIRKLDAQDIELMNGVRIPVSRSNRKAVQDFIEKI